ncbi:MAG: RNA polymerase subunit sigma-70, partial [Chloroflexi bacterium]|nr:RNA polymerase subunit sigma-70 [Chloroflexota bacterium]
MFIVTPPVAASERLDPDSTLARAKSGEQRSFAALTAPYLRELHVHCYRMLGSVTDADDLLQETLAAAWQGLPGFAGDSSLRTWLYRIATNRCLNAIRHDKRRSPPEPLPPFDPPPPSRRGDVTWLEPYPDDLLAQLPDHGPGPDARYELHESIELAVITALQRLPPRQTAALLLCDVLGFSPSEVAGMLATSPTAVKGLLQRARASISQPPRADQLPCGSPQERHLAAKFATAFTADDIDAVVALLTDDAWLAMPPAPHEYHGRDAIAAFLRASAAWRAPRRVHLRPTRANTQPAFEVFFTAPDGSGPKPAGAIVLTLTPGGIAS